MSSYNHLKKCELGTWQGLYRMYTGIPVVSAILEVQTALNRAPAPAPLGRMFQIGRITGQTCMKAILLADFLFQKIAFSAKDANKVRKIKNALKVQGSFKDPHKWFERKKSNIEAMLILLKEPLKKEGDQEIKVGPFSLQNPIHLNEEKVEKIEEAIEKALKLCTNSLAPGFTNALYGNVTLVEEIGRKHWAAWYSGVRDDITMKYFENRETNGFIQTFIHELGHRYYQRVISADKKRLWAIYDKDCHNGSFNLKDWVGRDDLGIYGFTQVVSRGRNKGLIQHLWNMTPSPGSFPLRIKTYLGSTVILETVDGELWGDMWDASPIKEVVKSRTGIFPSWYATTDKEEHFCEALAHKAVGKLHPKSLEAFNSIILKGEAYKPNSDDFKSDFVSKEKEVKDLVKDLIKETQVEDKLPSKKEMNTKAESLANRLGLKFEAGRKYGLFIYTNEAVGSTHTYMFLDYTTGNFFSPKSKAVPNTSMNLANITDSDLDEDLGFERMSNLKPKWRTMFTLTAPVKEAEVEEIIDQTPEPEVAITPEVNEEGIIEASMKLATALGMGYKVVKKFVRIDYFNQEQGTTHTYLLIDKDSGIVYPPKHRQLIKESSPFGSVLEPNILSKVNTEKMDAFLPAWRTKFVHPKRK